MAIKDDLEKLNTKMNFLNIFKTLKELKESFNSLFFDFQYLSKQEGPIGPAGPQGESISGPEGKPGKDADEEAIVQRVLSLIPIPKDGKDGLSPEVDYEKIVREVVALIPRPKDGKDAVIDYPELISQVLARIPKPKDGVDGKEGAPGAEGKSITGPQGRDGSPDTPLEIKAKLESLHAGNKLSMSAIEDLLQSLEDIRTKYRYIISNVGNRSSSEGGTSSQWTDNGNDIYFDRGSVGIGAGAHTPTDLATINPTHLISSNVLVNGGFTGSLSGWTYTIGNGWTYNTNKALYTPQVATVADPAYYLYQNFTATSGHIYTISFTISGMTQGAIGVYDNAHFGFFFDAFDNGDYSFTFDPDNSVGTGTYQLTVDPTDLDNTDGLFAFDGNISNIVIQDNLKTTNVLGIYDHLGNPVVKSFGDGNLVFNALLDTYLKNNNSKGWIFNFKNKNQGGQLIINAEIPMSAGNGNFGMDYFNNNQFIFGFFNGLGARIRFAGNSAFLDNGGGQWGFPPNAHLPNDVLLTSDNDSGDDVRLRVSKTGNGASQTIYEFTQVYADSVIQPARKLQAQSWAFYVRSDNIWNHNIKDGGGADVLFFYAEPTTGHMAIGGSTAPTAWLHFPAGTATAGTAPQKDTSGTLLTTAEAGAREFLTDKWYGTITTGAARKEFTLNDAALTSGKIPVATTNGRLTDSAFAATDMVKMVIALFDHFADANNGTTVETDLYSDTITAGKLTADGDKITARYQGIFTGAALATQDLRVYFGGTKIYDSGALSIGAVTSNWTLELTIIRVSASVVRCSVSVSSDFATLFPYSSYTEITGLTLANTQILKITGQAAGAGGASNQITSKLGTVSYQGAA